MTAEAPNLAEVVDWWLAHCQDRVDLARSTLTTYARISRHLRAWGRGQTLGRVSMTPYVRLRQSLRMAPRTIALELRVAAAAFRWAKATRRLGPDAHLEVPRLKVDPNRFYLNHRTPEPHEVVAVLDAMPPDDFRLAVQLMAVTGARVGEVVQLRGCDLDEPGQRVAFGASDGAAKTGLRWFPLDTATCRALAGRSEHGTDPLFDFGGLTAPIQGLERRLFQACKQANVSRFTPHGLRRMVVNRLMRARVDPGTAAALTGHSVQVMLRHYQQVSDEDRREAATRARLGMLDAAGEEG